MARLIILFVIAFLVFALLRGLLAKKNLTVKQFFAIYFATLLGIALLFLAITGRLHPVFAVLGAILPFMSRIIGFIMSGAQVAAIIRAIRGMGWSASAGQAQAPLSSEITTRYIHMVLFHETGMMDGTVLEGSFKDAKLAELELAQLSRLMAEIQADPDSVNLLVAYLDREHEGWQSATEDFDYTRNSSSGESGTMDEAQALDILGLDESATQDDIIQAHRRMMQKMHPDRGGSTYLAAKINAAKDLLLQVRNG